MASVALPKQHLSAVAHSPLCTPNLAAASQRFTPSTFTRQHPRRAACILTPRRQHCFWHAHSQTRTLTRASSLTARATPSMKPVELDGTTGEGGGQLVRVAVGLSALTSQPVRIVNVRGNREGGRGGGLKVQHVTSISWLAQATGAAVEGLSVGSKNLTFIPKKSPLELANREFHIKAESDAASTLLILQAMTPYLLFAANDAGDPVTLHIQGGTNVDWSLSYEYFDQILMPTLEERFGLKIERQLNVRGWSLGAASRGSITLKIHPVPKGQTLKYTPPKKYTFPKSYDVAAIDVSIITPIYSHSQLQSQLVKDIGALYPDADVQFKLVQDSGSDSRWSVLLVARSVDGIRWGRDILRSMPKKAKAKETFVKQLSSTVCRGLHAEVSLGGQVDEFLQDQVVALQALCEGYSSFPRGEDPANTNPEAELVGQMDNLTLEGSRVWREKTAQPFGRGSLHTQTARWVVSQLLPKAEFYNKGDFVKGVGFSL